MDALGSACPTSAEQARVVREQQCYRGLVGRSKDIRGLSHSEDS